MLTRYTRKVLASILEICFRCDFALNSSLCFVFLQKQEQNSSKQ